MANRVMNLWTRIVRQDEGSQLVELALSLLLLIPLIIGTMELAMGFFAFNEVTDAARTASRWAMVRGSTSCANTPSLSKCDATDVDIRTYVRGIGYPLLTSSNITVTTNWLVATQSTPTSWSACTPVGSDACKVPGNQVQITVSYSLPLILKFWTSTNKFTAQRSTWAISSTAAETIAQ